MKECPGWSHLVMKSNPRVPSDRPLIAIGYKYKSWKVLVFIDTDRYGSNDPNDPYLSCFPDNYSNVSICPFVRPHIIGSYFKAFNTIDNHNRMRKYDLALEKYWVTQSGYSRLSTIVALRFGYGDNRCKATFILWYLRSN